MRRIILLLVLCVCAAGAFAYNESVAAISFNPSRLGAYTKLKAVETAKLEGGVMVDGGAHMNLQTNDGKIELRDFVEAHECTSGDGKCVKYDKGTGSGNLNVINTIEPDSGATKTSFEGTGIIQKASSSPVENYRIDSDSQPTGGTNGTNISIFGGTLDATNGQAYIESFAQNDPLKNLSLGTSSQLIQNLTAKNAFTVMEKFTFGNITVESGNCTGGPCWEYKFITRVDDSGTEHNILAVKVTN